MGSQDTRDWEDRDEDRIEEHESRWARITVWGFIALCALFSAAVFAWGIVACVKQVGP